MRRSILVATAVSLLCAPAARAADGDIIVRREPGLDRHERAELRADADVKLVESLPIERTELVAPRDGDVGEALAELRADDAVVSAEPDRRVGISLAPTAFEWWSLWALEQNSDADIDALSAWQQSLGTGVTVAVVDTGINAAHVDLAGQIADGGKDFVDGDDVPDDGNGHGTHVAGTIAALPGSEVIGVAPEAKVLPLRALDDEGSGWTSDIAAAFDYAGDLGVRVVNASLGGPYSDAIESVVEDHPGTLYVVAAGNDTEDNDVADPRDPESGGFPCALPEDNVLCVGASDRLDRPAYFTNYGATTVDLSAPGVGIESSYIGSPTAYKWMNGTSMATPHVVGAAALALAANPEATTSQLKWALTSSVDVKDALAGQSASGGRLNAEAAVAAITGEGVPPEPVSAPAASPTPTPTPTATPVAPAATPAPPAPAPEPPAPPAPQPPQPPPVQAPPPAPVIPVPVSTPPAVAPAPDLYSVRVRGSLARKRGKLRVRFSLTRSEHVRFRVYRRGSRHALASWTVRGRAGRNSVTVKRRLPTRRTLKRGRYTLKVGLGSTVTASRAVRIR